MPPDSTSSSPPHRTGGGSASLAEGSIAREAGSIWAHKPWWCQPWTILLTGVVAVLASWLLLHRWWISLPLALAVLAWWALFLVIVPAAWRQAVQADQPAREPTS